MCLVFPHFFIIRLGVGFFSGRVVLLIWESGGRVILLFPKFEIFSSYGGSSSIRPEKFGPVTKGENKNGKVFSKR